MLSEAQQLPNRTLSLLPQSEFSDSQGRLPERGDSLARGLRRTKQGQISRAIQSQLVLAFVARILLVVACEILHHSARVNHSVHLAADKLSSQKLFSRVPFVDLPPTAT